MAKGRCGGRPRGFSLIEVLVSSVVFLVIFMGLATGLQSILMVNHLATGTSECLDRYRLGMRVLRYGDGTIPGMAAAASATINANGRLAFWNPATPNNWEWGLATGTLFARILPGGTPVVVIGDDPDSVAGVRVASPTTGRWVEATTSASGSCMVRLRLRLFYDINHHPSLGNHVCDGNEPEMTMQTAIFLRNSDK